MILNQPKLSRRRDTSKKKYCIALALPLLFSLLTATYTQAQTGPAKPDPIKQLQLYGTASCQLLFAQDYSCSCALINNNQQAGLPLILTAAHCLESQLDLANLSVKFGSNQSTKNAESRSWSSRGATLLASSKQLDFALLKLHQNIPADLAPIYLGWNKTLSQPSIIYSIHSPNFKATQYAFSLSKPSLTSYNGLYHGIDFGHWKVDQWSYGGTAPGSSGAPLLNEHFEIIGGLSGSTDWKRYKSDYFFRFDLAYDYFDEPGKQLKAWLDPHNLGRMSSYQPHSLTDSP